jgi:phospholipase C
MASNSYVGTSNCQAKYPVQRPPVPYGQQNDTSEALWFEDGYKECVGYLTEGRYLVFERAGYALTNAGDHLSISPAVPDHSKKNQRWVIHYSDGEESGLFLISSALDGKWLGPKGTLLPANRSDQAAQVKITFLGNGRGYSLEYAAGSKEAGLGGKAGFKVWSVTYHN